VKALETAAAIKVLRSQARCLSSQGMRGMGPEVLIKELQQMTVDGPRGEFRNVVRMCVLGSVGEGGQRNRLPLFRSTL
jgi:hypothetical protein